MQDSVQIGFKESKNTSNRFHRSHDLSIVERRVVAREEQIIHSIRNFHNTLLNHCFEVPKLEIISQNMHVEELVIRTTALLHDDLIECFEELFNPFVERD